MAKLTRKEKIKQGIPKPYKGRRKRLLKQRLREKKASLVQVKLRNFPYSPRKMRPIAKMIAGKSVLWALGALKWTTKKGAYPLRKLIYSAIDVWEQKHGELPLDEEMLYIKEIKVDEGMKLKRIRPAPFGRAHPIRKRRCHVTLTLGYRENNENLNS